MYNPEDEINVVMACIVMILLMWITIIGGILYGLWALIF